MTRTWQDIVTEKFNNNADNVPKVPPVAVDNPKKIVNDNDIDVLATTPAKNETESAGEDFSILFTQFKEQVEEHNQKTVELTKIKDGINNSNREHGFEGADDEVKPIYLDAIDDPRVTVLMKMRAGNARQSIIENYNEKVKTFTEETDKLIKSDRGIRELLRTLLEKAKNETEIKEINHVIEGHYDPDLQNIYKTMIIQERVRRNPLFNNGVNREAIPIEKDKPSLEPLLVNNSLNKTISPVDNSDNNNLLKASNSLISDIKIDKEIKPNTNDPVSDKDLRTKYNFDREEERSAPEVVLGKTDMQPNDGDIKIGFGNADNSQEDAKIKPSILPIMPSAAPPIMPSAAPRMPSAAPRMPSAAPPIMPSAAPRMPSAAPIGPISENFDTPSAMESKDVVQQEQTKIVRFSPNGTSQEITQNGSDFVDSTTKKPINPQNLATARVELDEGVHFKDSIEAIKNRINPTINGSNTTMETPATPFSTDIFAKQGTEPPKLTIDIPEPVAEIAEPVVEPLKPAEETTVPKTQNIQPPAPAPVGAETPNGNEADPSKEMPAVKDGVLNALGNFFRIGKKNKGGVTADTANILNGAALEARENQVETK